MTINLKGTIFSEKAQEQREQIIQGYKDLQSLIEKAEETDHV